MYVDMYKWCDVSVCKCWSDGGVDMLVVVYVCWCVSAYMCGCVDKYMCEYDVVML